VYRSGYHEDVIGPPDILDDSPRIGETPVRATVSLATDCREGVRLAKRLRKHGMYAVSGTGHFIPEYTGFIVDCICAVEEVGNPTREQLNRLRVP